MKMTLGDKVVDDYEVEFDYISGPDDYAGWVSWAVFTDGTTATDEELDKLTDMYPEAVDEAVIDHAVSRVDFRD